MNLCKALTDLGVNINVQCLENNLWWYGSYSGLISVGIDRRIFCFAEIGGKQWDFFWWYDSNIFSLSQMLRQAVNAFLAKRKELVN